jgi:glutamyl-tRNA synthetase
LERAFSIDGISKSPAVFDYDKLNWFNAEYIKAMGEEGFTSHAMPYYREVFGEEEKPWDVLYSILPARITKFQEIPGLLHFFQELPDYPADFFVNKKSKTNLENSPQMLQAAIAALEALPQWEITAIHDSLMALAGELGVKNGTLLWPVRIAAAGTLVTPGGAMEILTLLGREEALRRLKAGLAKLQG